MFISSLRAARLYGAGAALFVASSSICRADLLVTTSTTLDTPITGNVIIASTDPYNYATAINVNIVNGREHFRWRYDGGIKRDDHDGRDD